MKSLVAVEANIEKFKGLAGSGRWTLCVGAGLSRGVAPTWFELTLRIVNEVFSTNYTNQNFGKLVQDTGWSLDAWIQAGANEYKLRGKTEADFIDLIESILYSNLRKAASGLPLENHLFQVLNNARTTPRVRVLEVCDFLESEFSQSSVLGVARFLIAAAKAGKTPYSVITFNADTLLETLVDLFLRRDHYLGPGPHSHPNYFYKPVRRPQDISSNKTFVFHCHGTIMPRLLNSKKLQSDGRDRLVFLEQEYLRIASTSASWPESLFQFHSQTTRMLFVGLSMSDANIRRWMATTNASVTPDYELLTKGQRVNPQHLWFTKKPSNLALQRLNLVSLLHLGIRPAWIEDWSQISQALSNIVGLQSSS
jgi:hypothetical protein